jgi:ATP-dependent DNA ligase
MRQPDNRPMSRMVARQRTNAAALPQWVMPQLTQLVEAAPGGDQWLHEIKYDGYRMHARLDRGVVKLLTRTGLDWTHKYPAIAKAVAELDARQAYLDGELCGVGPDGITAVNIFSLPQTAAMRRRWSTSCSTFSISTARICANAH